jgi:hypothetical protein
MRIPTVIALALLAIAIFLGVFIYKANQARSKQESAVIAPNNIESANITDTQATIIWQTQTPSTGLVSYGTSQFLGSSQNDDRDGDNPQPHLTHFVTLKNLTPDTSYFFRVRSGPYFYPDNPMQFKTAKTTQTPEPPISSDSAKLNSPIFGVVLSPTLSPIDEAIIQLKIPGAEELATLTTTAGNFILPLVNLKKNDLSDNFFISTRLGAHLIATRGSLSSDITLTIPTPNVPLPKIVLGQNSDFSSFLAASSSAVRTNPLDLNSDGVVNALDKSIILDNIGRSPTDPRYNPDADLNHDGVVDQKDLDQINKVVKQ